MLPQPVTSQYVSSYAVARLAVVHPVVEAAVVEAAERQRRPVGRALGGVVVDDVEDHLEAGGVERPDHLLELPAPARPGRRTRSSRDEGRRSRSCCSPSSSPCPRAITLRLADELLHRQQLDRGHPEVAQVVGHRGRGQPGVRATQVLGHPVVQGGHPLDVQLVDHRVAPPRVRPAVVAPVEVRVVHDDRPSGRTARSRAGLRWSGESVSWPKIAGSSTQRPADRPGVGVEQQLVGVEPQPESRRPRPVGPVAVAGAGRDAGDGAVPDAERHLGQLDAGSRGRPRRTGRPTPRRLGRADREVRGLLVLGRTQRPGAARPHRRGLAGSAPGSGGHPRHCVDVSAPAGEVGHDHRVGRARPTARAPAARRRWSRPPVASEERRPHG